MRAPPHNVASMGSMGPKGYTTAMRSMATELTAMEKREEASRWKPIYRQPAINSGTFKTMVKTPTGMAGSSALMTWARPVIPPMATWLGSKNQSNARPKITDPRAIMP